jgi:hypothetical protein
MSFSKRRVALAAAAAMTASLAALPLSAFAYEASFGALQGIEAQPLSTAEMDAVHGQAYTLAILALLAYAAKIQATQPQTATQYTTIATALSTVKVTTTRYFTTTSSTRILVRR